MVAKGIRTRALSIVSPAFCRWATEIHKHVKYEMIHKYHSSYKTVLLK